MEVATDENFQNIVNSRDTTKSQEDLTTLKLNPGLHYWRIFAVNKKNKMTVSNTGRFKVLPPLERTVIVDESKVFEKEWKSRFFLGWAPSLDSYTFEDSQKGEISGTTLMSPRLSVDGIYIFSHETES